MGVISKDTIRLMWAVREKYPDTWEWVRHKANLEGMCIGAIFEHYRKHIEELMEEEKVKCVSALSDC